MITIQPGDLVVSGINAAKGAIAIYEADDQKPIAATIHYSSYEVDNSKADTRVMWWLLHSNTFRDLLAQFVPGGIKTELKAKRLLTVPIPLPPIHEQRRIVARIESLAGRIDDAKQLKRSIQVDMDSLLVAMAHRNDLNEEEKKAQGWARVVLGEVLTQVSDPVDVEPGKVYPHFGVYGFSRGLFKKSPLLGDEIKATKLYRVRKGHFIYSRLKAFEGAFCWITKETDEHFVSNEFPTFKPDTNHITNEFLFAYLKSPRAWQKFAVHSKGLGARRERLKPVDFLSYEVWLPPIEWQHKIKTVSEKLVTSKADWDAAGRQLDALLPSILDKAFKGEL